jgi:hypothetical protein
MSSHGFETARKTVFLPSAFLCVLLFARNGGQTGKQRFLKRRTHTDAENQLGFVTCAGGGASDLA